MIAAASDTFWAGGAICRKKYRVTCTGAAYAGIQNPCLGRSVVVKIVDHCPAGCTGSIDLSQKKLLRPSRIRLLASSGEAIAISPALVRQPRHLTRADEATMVLPKAFAAASEAASPSLARVLTATSEVATPDLTRVFAAAGKATSTDLARAFATVPTADEATMASPRAYTAAKK
ncbi:hypothetical protein NL676_031908 [Syzygium grande]|nr:hypothetical protein NL676_031908 [Syzygium grande]